MKMTDANFVAMDSCNGLTSTPAAIDAFTKGCTLKNGESCMELAARYLCGANVAKDAAKATDFSERACDLGAAQGCNLAAMSLVTAAEPSARAAAMHYAQHGCDLGDEMSCTDVGIIYMEGLGVAVDFTRAAQIFETYCKRSSMTACANLALLVYMGNGTPRDPVRAKDLAQRSCDAHMDAGCNVLGAVLMDANDAASAASAEQIFAGLCDRGQGGGCDNLGVLYMRGLAGRAPDRDRALPAFKRACDLGNAIGCTHLGQVSAGP